jgi:ABC-2 type transport system ATP-binding protein
MEKRKLLISISHLKKSYGEKKVLRDINLTIGRGEVVGLLGINGAGKTTLMSCIAGTVPFSEGDIQFCGSNLIKNSHELNKIGFLIKARFLEYLTAEENLRVLGAYAGISEKELDTLVPETLRTVQLYEKRKEYTTGFSFGQQQRLGVAQAILGEKKLLVLDEPFVGLDSEGKEMLENLIRDKSRKDGTAVLLSSHDMEEIEKVCDRIVIMKDGNVVFDNAFEVKQIAHIQLKVQGKEFEKYLNLFPWRGKVTVLTNANGLIEVKDMEILGEILNQLGKDGMIEKVYTKENSIQELFDSVTRKVL